MGVIFGAVMSLSYLIMALSVREPEQVREVTQPPLRSILTTPGYLRLIALFVSVTLGLGIVSSMLPFYLASLQLGPSEQTLILGLLFVAAIVALPLWNLISGHLSKPLTLALGLAVLVVGLLLIVFAAPSAGSLVAPYPQRRAGRCWDRRGAAVPLGHAARRGGI